VPNTKVDVKIDTKIAELFNLEGLSTLKLFVNGEAIGFIGGCSAKEIFG
jgi:hypothetical protein